MDETQQPYPAGLRRAYGQDGSQRRVVSASRRGGGMRMSNTTSGAHTDASTDQSSTAFSDEYDLCE